MTKPVKRCDWCGSDSYFLHDHDNECVLPVYNARKLF